LNSSSKGFYKCGQKNFLKISKKWEIKITEVVFWENLHDCKNAHKTFKINPKGTKISQIKADKIFYYKKW